jgi:hypothetical protein
MLPAEPQLATGHPQQSPQEHLGQAKLPPHPLAAPIDLPVARTRLAPPPLGCAERSPSPSLGDREVLDASPTAQINVSNV